MSDLEQDILTVVAILRLHPTELLGAMRGGRPDTEVKDACLSLMHAGRLILSSDRYWEVPQVSKEKSVVFA